MKRLVEWLLKKANQVIDHWFKKRPESIDLDIHENERTRAKEPVSSCACVGGCDWLWRTRAIIASRSVTPISLYNSTFTEPSRAKVTVAVRQVMGSSSTV